MKLPGGGVYWVENFIGNGLARMAVPFFFISSAFFQYSKTRTTKSVYISKIKTLVIPYLFWNTMYMVIFTALRKASLVSSVGLTEITLVAIMKDILFYGDNSAFWFMYQLILLNLFYPVISCILKKKNFSIALIAGLWILYVCKGDFFPVDSYYCFKLSAMICFIIGAVCGKYYKEKIVDLSEEKARYIMFGSGAVFIILLYTVMNSKVDFISNLDLVRNISLVVFLFILLDYIPWKMFTISVSTFMVYALHILILESIEKITYRILPKSDSVALIVYIFAPIITIGLIVLICKIGRRVCPKAYAVVSGNRG